MAEQENQNGDLNEADFASIANPTTEARGARGDRARLGRHWVTIRASRYFKSRGDEGPIPTCVIEEVVEKTVSVGSRSGMLNDEEKGLGLDPFGSDAPHGEGEVLSTVWKKSGKSIVMFDGNVKGYLVHAKQSVLNMVKALRDLADAEGDATKKAHWLAEADAGEQHYKSNGLDMSPDKKDDVTPTESVAIFGKKQLFQGVVVQLIVSRTKTKAGKHINTQAYEPVAVADWKSMFVAAKAA